MFCKTLNIKKKIQKCEMLSLSEEYHLKKLKIWKLWSVAKGILSELTHLVCSLLRKSVQCYIAQHKVPQTTKTVETDVLP